MLIIEDFGIEKVDSINFRVFKVGQSASETVVKKGVTYHGNLQSALTKVRSLMQNEKYHNNISDVDNALKRMSEIDDNFFKALDKLTSKKFYKALEDPETVTKVSA